MKRLAVRLSAVLVFVMLASGCYSVKDTKHFSVGRKSGLDLPMPSPGKSKVVFIRPAKMGYALQFSVHDGEKLAGVVPAKGFIQYECEPGKHQFSTSMENVSILDAELLPDRIYYAKVGIRMGMWIARVKMYSLHPNCAGNLWPELPGMLGDLTEAVVKPEAIEKDKRGIASYMDRKRKYESEPRDEQILPEHGLAKPIGAK